MIRPILTVLLSLLYALASHASTEVRSRHITTDNGLANNTVRHMMQDSNGFIWFGTFNGLNRYDGNSFISYYPSEDNNRLSLADGRIYELDEDGNGFLWIYSPAERFSCYDLRRACFVDFTGCGEYMSKYSARMSASNGDTWLWHKEGGARKITYRAGKFVSELYDAHSGKLPSDRVAFVDEDKNGVVWIGTNDGLVRVDGESSLVMNRGEQFRYAAFNDGKVWLCSSEGKIYSYEDSGQKLVHRGSIPSGDFLISGQLKSGNKWYIFTTKATYVFDFINMTLSAATILNEQIRSGQTITDNKGNYWVYNRSGRMWYLNNKTGQWKVFRLIPEEKLSHIDYERYQIVHDSRNIIWISTYGNGLYAYDTEKDETTHFSADIAGLNHISSDYLLDVMEDRSGAIWVSSEYTGVSCFSVINEGVTRVLPENPNLFDRSNTVRMLSVFDDELWVATRKGGLYIYDKQYNLKSSLTNLPYNIYVATRDSEGRKWIGSRGNGLKIDNVWYYHTDRDTTSLGNDNIFALHEDAGGRMWVGTFGGGLDLAVKTGKEFSFRHFLRDNVLQSQIRTICGDRNGWMWIGTSDGIYIFNPDELIRNPRAYHYYNSPDEQSRSYEVKHIYSDHEGTIWIAMSGLGVSLCRPEGDYSALRFETYGLRDGLCSDMVRSIVEDANGDVWLATEYGLSKFVRGKKIFENYFLSSFSQGNVYAEAAAAKTKDGKLLFGTNFGFISFAPHDIQHTEAPTPAIFTNLNINGNDIRPDEQRSPISLSMAYTDAIKLPHNQNSIKIDFSSFNYGGPEQTKYSYILKNYDNAWSAPSTSGSAVYKMLSPGKYELTVRSCNAFGVWNEEVSSLSITIRPPFYLTVWAFLFYVVAAAAICVIIYRIVKSFNRLNNKMEVEKQLTEYKLVFFTNISHEFRTPLTLIKGALERIRATENMPKKAESSLQTMEKGTDRMVRLIDQLLEFRKMQNNKLALALEKTDVVAMLYEIFLSFQDMAQSKNIDFRFMPSVQSYKMYVDKGKLDKMVYNILSNAFKYTPSGGTIQLYAAVGEEGEDMFVIRVEDSGVGIPKEKQAELFSRFMQSHFSRESMGIGLHLTQELVTVHKGRISYQENQGGGSVFSIRLPLSENVYDKKDFLVATDLLKNDSSGTVIREDIGVFEIPETIASSLNEQKILIIEDDDDVRKYLKESLETYFQVDVAADGKEGFELASESVPDLIVSDVLMPEMTGYEVAARLKSNFNTSHIPIILITALALPEDHLKGIESGADAYLAKPFSIRLLLARIVKLLEQREILKEKFSREPGVVRTAVYASNCDKNFVEELNRILTENLDNASFSVDTFASMMKMGRTLFYKKMKGVTGYSPNEYLRIMRMKKAAELLLSEPLTVAEVSYRVGIEDPFYFSKCFKAQFGVSPSVYKKGD